MRVTVLAAAACALLPCGAWAQELPTQETWRLIYLRGSNAPAPLVHNVETELTKAIELNGILLAEPNDGPDPSAAIAKAQEALELGVREFTQLKLDDALVSFREAEAQASNIVTAPDGPRIVFESRLHRARILFVQGKNEEATDILRLAASTGPAAVNPKQFPPEIVDGYAEARKKVLQGTPGVLRLKVTPAKARITVNGIRWKGQGQMKLPAGEHIVTASTKTHAPAGLRVTITAGQESAADLFLEPTETAAVLELQNAWRRGLPAEAAQAAHEILEGSSAQLVLGWDLRSVDGEIQALLIPINRSTLTAPPPRRVALPAGAVGARQVLEPAIASLLQPVAVAENTRTTNRKVWYWTAAAIGAAALAGGGAALVARQGPSGGNDDLLIIISR